MSKTKIQASPLGRGVTRTRHKRHGETAEHVRIAVDEAGSLRSLGMARGGTLEQIQVARLAAERILKARGLPGDPMVDYTPAEPGAKPHIARLPAYLARLGFGRLDNEYLAAVVIAEADIILRGKAGREGDLRAMTRLVRAADDLARLLGLDAAAAGRGQVAKVRPYSVWVRPLARLMVRTLPDATDKECWHDIPDEPADLTVCDDGGVEWIIYRSNDPKAASRERLFAYARHDEKAAHMRGPTFRTFADYFLRPLRNSQKT